jgi:hypothetical protein
MQSSSSIGKNKFPRRAGITALAARPCDGSGRGHAGRTEANGVIHLIQGAKVEGAGVPHINRSVEAKAMLVFGGCFFPSVAELHPDEH